MADSKRPGVWRTWYVVTDRHGRAFRAYRKAPPPVLGNYTVQLITATSAADAIALVEEREKLKRQRGQG